MRTAIVSLALLLFAGCAQQDDAATDAAPSTPKPLLIVEAPEPLPVPDRVSPSSDTDWKARVNNKEAEVVEVINVINPVAAFITEGFKQYGPRFSEGLHEEWADTQVQLTKALTLYGDCKTRKTGGQFDKKLFLDLEETWQLLVKTGVAGLRTKTMVEAEIRRLTRV